jgi:REP element-mobilizing transposase RayT
MTRKDPKPLTFHPIDPWKSDLLSYRRRHLPHFEVSDATYFVTFNIRSGLFLHDAARDQVMGAIKVCDNVCIELRSAVVMPDHVHLIFRILEGSLATVLQKIKGSSARNVNIVLNRTGSLWMEESFDHIIRHETELQEKIDYIQNNPVKKGLVDVSQQYKWLYVAQASACDSDP